MKSKCLFLILVISLWVVTAYGSENIALLEKGGSVEFIGVAYSNSGVENAFNGDLRSQFAYDIVRRTENRNVPVDRIWDSKARIDKIELRTAGGGRAYEYKFLYWDLGEKVWKEIIHINENQNMQPVHNLASPIITNKLRYICMKSGPEGTANFHNVYQIFYYGEFIASTPLDPPINVNAAVNEIGYIQLNWELPKPSQDGELPQSFNIYRSTDKNFEASSDNLVADNIKSNRWFDLTAKASDSFYYIVQSVGEFGEGDYSKPVGIK